MAERPGRTRLLRAAWALTAALALAACGGEGDDPGPTADTQATSSPTREADALVCDSFDTALLEEQTGLRGWEFSGTGRAGGAEDCYAIHNDTTLQVYAELWPDDGGELREAARRVEAPPEEPLVEEDFAGAPALVQGSPDDTWYSVVTQAEGRWVLVNAGALGGELEGTGHTIEDVVRAVAEQVVALS